MKDTFTSDFKRKTRDFLKGLTRGDLFGAVSIALSIIALSRYISEGIEIVFGAYIFTLAGLLVWREYTFSRKARYAEASNSLRSCASAIRDAHEAVNEKNKKLADTKIHDALVSFAQAFSLICGANCRACIKTLVTSNDDNNHTQPDFYTETLARSKSAGILTEDHPAPIKENTDFNVLFSGEQDVFICDDLTKEVAYMNSNWPDNPDKRKEYIKQRKIKYVTTIVWPIKSSDSYSNEKPGVVGYLCVDSLTRNIFEPRYDIDLGFVVADLLYPLLIQYRNMPSLQKISSTSSE